MLKRIGFAGTFDPITKGHLWVIGEAENIAEEVIIMIAHNNAKSQMFTIEERKHIIEQSIREEGYHKSKVEIVHNEYTATYAKKNNIDYLIRGIRSTVDFDYENTLQQANTSVLQGAKTLFVMPPRDLGSVSSSFVKSLIGPKNWQFYIKQFLTESAFSAISFDWLKKNIDMPESTIAQLYSNTIYEITILHLITAINELQQYQGLSGIEKTELKKYFLYKELLHPYHTQLFLESNGKHVDTFELQMPDSQEECMSHFQMRATEFEHIKQHVADINQYINSNTRLVTAIASVKQKMMIDRM